MVSAPQVQSSVNHPGTPGSERKGDTNHHKCENGSINLLPADGTSRDPVSRQDCSLRLAPERGQTSILRRCDTKPGGSPIRSWRVHPRRKRLHQFLDQRQAHDATIPSREFRGWLLLGLLHVTTGNVKIKTAPRSRLFFAVIVPPWASVMRFEMLRPRP
jgi:hypothetical protein